MIGSDEVFNCIQKNSNVGYSLELFGKDNHAKRLLTYAASFGNTTLEKLEKYKKADEVGVLLKKFDAISVRDANSGAIVERLTEKKPVYNLDPVLTYDYMNCCDKIPQLRVDEKYLILYAYGKHFMDGDCYRESCYKCAYANTSRVGDLTVGDFWGIAKSHPSFNSPKGVSSVFVNTEKGQKLFEMMRVLAEVEEATLEEGMVKQHNLVQPSNRPVTRDTFYKSVDEPGFIENIKVGFQPKARLKSVLPNKLIQKIKSL